MPSKYSDELKAEVLADARLGRPTSQIGMERNLPRTTIQDWIHDAKELARSENRDPLLFDGEYRIAFMTQDLTEQAIESLKESGEPLHKYLVPLNIIRGTAIDKVMRQKEQSQPQNLAQLVIVVNAAAPLPEPEIVIEGEIVDAVQES